MLHLLSGRSHSVNKAGQQMISASRAQVLHTTSFLKKELRLNN